MDAQVVLAEVIEFTPDQPFGEKQQVRLDSFSLI
jgi:hypothetical protein